MLSSVGNLALIPLSLPRPEHACSVNSELAQQLSFPLTVSEDLTDFVLFVSLFVKTASY